MEVKTTLLPTFTAAVVLAPAVVGVIVMVVAVIIVPIINTRWVNRWVNRWVVNRWVLIATKTRAQTETNYASPPHALIPTPIPTPTNTSTSTSIRIHYCPLVTSHRLHLPMQSPHRQLARQLETGQLSPYKHILSFIRYQVLPKERCIPPPSLPPKPLPLHNIRTHLRYNFTHLISF